jgi:small subunit ribosomal protein S20
MAKRNKSALKRQRQNEKRRLRNRYWKTRVKNVMKEVRMAVEARDLPRAEESLKKAVSIIQKTVSKGVLHLRTASRYISKLSRLVYSLKRELSQKAQG